LLPTIHFCGGDSGGACGDGGGWKGCIGNPLLPRTISGHARLDCCGSLLPDCWLAFLSGGEA
jgi:hypothetical protein